LRQALFFGAVGGAVIVTGLLTTTVVVGLLVAVFFIVVLGQFMVLQGRLNKDLAGLQPIYERGKWMKAALILMPAMVITWNFPTLNIAIAGFLMGPSEVAIYNAAYRTSEILVFGGYAVYVAFATRISAVYATEDRGALQRLVTRQAQITFFPTVAGAIGLALIGEFALGLFGQRFLDGYFSLTILLAGLVIFAFVSPASHLLVISGRESTFLAVTVLTFVIAVIGNLILIPKYGINGAATAVLLSQVFQSIALHFLVRKILNIDATPFGFLGRQVSA
jgi:O-antigen/teichoic acid export membrane protein